MRVEVLITTLFVRCRSIRAIHDSHANKLSPQALSDPEAACRAFDKALQIINSSLQGISGMPPLTAPPLAGIPPPLAVIPPPPPSSKPTACT